MAKCLGPLEKKKSNRQSTTKYLSYGKHLVKIYETPLKLGQRS